MELLYFSLSLQDKKELEKKKRELKKLEEESGGEEKRGQEVEEAVKRARNRLAALAKGMTTDEQGQAVTLDAQLTSMSFFCRFYYSLLL